MLFLIVCDCLQIFMSIFYIVCPMSEIVDRQTLIKKSDKH